MVIAFNNPQYLLTVQ